jgi:hypothetical protein
MEGSEALRMAAWAEAKLNLRGEGEGVRSAEGDSWLSRPPPVGSNPAGLSFFIMAGPQRWRKVDDVHRLVAS